MSASAYKFTVEMKDGDPTRTVFADAYAVDQPWLIFYVDNPQGGRSITKQMFKMDSVVSLLIERARR